MAVAFDRHQLLAALDRIGVAARDAGVVLHIAVYGGSALMLASNFRFTSEDVDIAELPKPWPEWLRVCVDEIARENDWAADWLNDAVEFHLSTKVTRTEDHLLFGTFPRSDMEPGLMVYVPTSRYLLALKLKAIRVLDPVKGAAEAADIKNLMQVTGVRTPQAALELLAEYFPRTAVDPGKHLFLLRHLLVGEGEADAPEYPIRSD